LQAVALPIPTIVISVVIVLLLSFVMFFLRFLSPRSHCLVYYLLCRLLPFWANRGDDFVENCPVVRDLVILWKIDVLPTAHGESANYKSKDGLDFGENGTMPEKKNPSYHPRRARLYTSGPSDDFAQLCAFLHALSISISSSMHPHQSVFHMSERATAFVIWYA
jgi:hypothetical protein